MKTANFKPLFENSSENKKSAPPKGTDLIPNQFTRLSENSHDNRLFAQIFTNFSK